MGFFKQWRDDGFHEIGTKLTGSERGVNSIGDCGNKYIWTFLRSQLGMWSKSDYLVGQLDRILWITVSYAWVKTETLGGSRKIEWVRRWCSRVWIFCLRKKLQSSLQVKCQEKWLEVVRRICSVGACWLFAKNVWGCRRLMTRGWSSTLFCDRFTNIKRRYNTHKKIPADTRVWLHSWALVVESQFQGLVVGITCFLVHQRSTAEPCKTWLYSLVTTDEQR